MDFDTLAPHFAAQKEQKPVQPPSRTSLARKIKNLSPEKLTEIDKLVGEGQPQI